MYIRHFLSVILATLIGRDLLVAGVIRIDTYELVAIWLLLSSFAVTAAKARIAQR